MICYFSEVDCFFWFVGWDANVDSIPFNFIAVTRVHVQSIAIILLVFVIPNFIWFCLLLFCVRRLGIELGKSVVYQEPNRGEAVIHWLINMCLCLISWSILWYSSVLVFFLNEKTKQQKPTTLIDFWCWLFQRREWMWKNLSVDKTSSSSRPSQGINWWPHNNTGCPQRFDIILKAIILKMTTFSSMELNCFRCWTS